MGESKRKKIFYCNQCKAVINNRDRVFFLEQGTLRCFCSEKCTQSFFSPLVEYLEKEEANLRHSLGHVNDLGMSGGDLNHYLEQTLKNPQEIWLERDESTERIFYFISKFEYAPEANFYLVLATLVSENGPHFVLLHTLTQFEALVDNYRSGESIRAWDEALPLPPVQERKKSKGAGGAVGDVIEGELQRMDSLVLSGDMNEGEEGAEYDILPPVMDGNEEVVDRDEANSLDQNMEQIYLDPKELEAIEGRRSSSLAKLIELRSQGDIPLEFFGYYENCVQNTLDIPDEIYRHHESDGEVLFTYIKSFQVKEISFFYIVICLRYRTDRDSGEETLIPILSFPSIDGDLYHKYKKGEKISGVLKN